MSSKMELPPKEFADFYWSMVRTAESSPSYLHRFFVHWKLTRHSAGSEHAVVLENFMDNPAA